MDVFESDTVSLREVLVRKIMNSHKMFEGNSKGFKNWPICAKHAIFAIESSRMQVAKASRQNTQKNFEKFFLNVFRD